MNVALKVFIKYKNSEFTIRTHLSTSAKACTSILNVIVSWWLLFYPIRELDFNIRLYSSFESIITTVYTKLFKVNLSIENCQSECDVVGLKNTLSFERKAENKKMRDNLTFLTEK